MWKQSKGESYVIKINEGNEHFQDILLRLSVGGGVMEVVMPLEVKAGVGSPQQRGLEGLSPFRLSLHSSHPGATPDPFRQIEPSICQACKSPAHYLDFAPNKVCRSIHIQELVKKSKQFQFGHC